MNPNVPPYDLRSFPVKNTAGTHAMRPAKVVLYCVGIVLGAALLWLASSWMASQLGPSVPLRGDRATAAVSKLWQAPLPRDVEVIAVLRGGFQDPFIKLRIEAPPARRPELLAFLGASAEDLRQGRPHPTPDGPEDWWIWPTDPGSVFFADLQLDGFDGVDLTLRTIDGPPARDVYFLYLWTL